LDDPDEYMSNSEAFEREPADLNASVKLKKLTKVNLSNYFRFQMNEKLKKKNVFVEIYH